MSFRLVPLVLIIKVGPLIIRSKAFISSSHSLRSQVGFQGCPRPSDFCGGVESELVVLGKHRPRDGIIVNRRRLEEMLVAVFWYVGCGDGGLVLVSEAGSSFCSLYSLIGFQRCLCPSSFGGGGDSVFVLEGGQRPRVGVSVSIRRLASVCC